MLGSYVPWIVSVEWLAKRLEHPDIAIADCRFRLDLPDWGECQYHLGHIPRAYYFHLDRDLSSPIRRHGGRHPLPDPERFSQTLGRCGILKDRTWVIAYDDSRLAFAARLWWILRYLGHDKVAVLDGGWGAWIQNAYPVSSEIPAERAGNFQPEPRSHLVVHREALASPEPGRVTVDARDRDRYLGRLEPIDPVAGHIPGAANIPWQSFTDERGFIVPLSQQEALWQPYVRSPEIVAYCGSGVTACVNLLSLGLIGRQDAKLYPGGWSDWCSHSILVDPPD